MIHSTDMSGLALGFVHKRLLSGAKSFITSGFSPTAAAVGFATGGGGQRRPLLRRVPLVEPGRALPPTRGFQRPIFQVPVRRPVARSLTARPTEVSAVEKEAGRFAKFAGLTTGAALPCRFPMRRDPISGQCVRPFIGTLPGIDDPLERMEVGEATLGRYGAGMEPGSRIVDRAVCLRGMVLGNDGLCYNRSQVPNKDRMWPKARKPLLTGGEMRAISVAATAGRRLERATKRLQKIGLMKKPPPRRKATSGPTEHHHHD